MPGSGSLWRWSAARSQAELLLRVETNYQAAPVVALHGGAVAYVTDSAGTNDLYPVPSSRPDRKIQPVRLTHAASADEYFPTWSADGEGLAYARNGASPEPRGSLERTRLNSVRRPVTLR